MQADVVQAIFPVIDRVFAHFGAEESASEDVRLRLQNDLERLIAKSSVVDNRWDDRHFITDTLSGLHYLLVAWVDDTFTFSRRWGELWPAGRFETKFEQYQEARLNNLRSERFRALADEFGNRGLIEPMEAVWVLFHLGFRGDHRSEEIGQWFAKSRKLLMHDWVQQLTAKSPAVQEPPPPPPRLSEPVRERSAVKVIWLAAMAVWSVAALACLAFLQ